MKVLVSPNYGVGWSTLNKCPGIAIDTRLIEAFENGCSRDEMERLCIDYGYANEKGRFYGGGFNNLVVKEVPKGSIFRISEYDGAEYIEIFDSDEWFYAED